MFSLLRGECDHCGRAYRYSLLDAAFSDCSYAYCNTCGVLAIINYSSSYIMSMPQISTPHQVIDSAWEPYLRPCACGGQFRSGAAPRCMVCRRELSAVNATTHIERNFIAGSRTWSWQRNWTGSYCIDIESPALPGVPRHVENPFRDMKTKSNEAVPAAEPSKRGLLGRLFKSNS
jgi:hypothetical protein